MTRIIFLNVAWMKEYDDVREDDQPVNGGRHATERGWGSEIFNFRPFQETYYGYGPAGSISVTRLEVPPDADRATDVLVIWTATPQKGGRRIVGWYNHATVFSGEQPSPPAANRLLPDGSQAVYVARAAVENSVLLPLAERTCLLPPKGPGSMGQKPIWYADTAPVADFRESVINYVQQYSHIATLRKYGPGGEGEEHKRLKEWCAQNPQALGLNDVVSSATQKEYPFVHTGDRADVKFELTGGRYVALEVETDNAEPGAYQALKYRVLMCAEKHLPITSEKVEGLLVAWQVPQRVRQFCNEYHLGWREVSKQEPREVLASSQ